MTCITIYLFWLSCFTLGVAFGRAMPPILARPLGHLPSEACSERAPVGPEAAPWGATGMITNRAQGVKDGE
jgi:hypothetical protein